VTPQDLDAFLAYFTAHFDCGTLASQHARFVSGATPARPLLALTFDDAQYDNHRYARALLARHRLQASFFAPVLAVERQEPLWHDRLGFAVLALLGRGRDALARVLAAAGQPASIAGGSVEHVVEAAKRLGAEARLQLVDELEHAAGAGGVPSFARLMTFDELAELAADGHEIGSHSMTHRMLPECDDAALGYELAESRRVLQARLGRPIESFCYPNGDCDARTAGAAAGAGYLRAVTTRWGLNARRDERFQLRRCDMDARRVRDRHGRITPALIALRMSGWLPIR